MVLRLRSAVNQGRAKLPEKTERDDEATNASTGIRTSSRQAVRALWYSCPPKTQRKARNKNTKFLFTHCAVCCDNAHLYTATIFCMLTKIEWQITKSNVKVGQVLPRAEVWTSRSQYKYRVLCMMLHLAVVSDSKQRYHSWTAQKRWEKLP